MSKYSPEIIKATQELIEEHYQINDDIFSKVAYVRNPELKESAIKAAIVSCKFAKEVAAHLDDFDKITNIQSYLEELL